MVRHRDDGASRSLVAAAARRAADMIGNSVGPMAVLCRAELGVPRLDHPFEDLAGLVLGYGSGRHVPPAHSGWPSVPGGARISFTSTEVVYGVTGADVTG